MYNNLIFANIHRKYNQKNQEVGRATTTPPKSGGTLVIKCISEQNSTQIRTVAPDSFVVNVSAAWPQLEIVELAPKRNQYKGRELDVKRSALSYVSSAKSCRKKKVGSNSRKTKYRTRKRIPNDIQRK